MPKKPAGPSKRAAPSSPAKRAPPSKVRAAHGQKETKAGGARKRAAREGEGRPTKFTEEMLARVTRLCLLGLTDKQLAAALDISEATLNTWKREHPQFLESIRAGKVDADALVAASFFQRAKGYEVEVSKVVGRGEKARVVTVKEHVPGDAMAAYRWLTNRQREAWRDRREHEHGISDDLAQALGFADGKSKGLGGSGGLNGHAGADRGSEAEAGG